MICLIDLLLHDLLGKLESQLYTDQQDNILRQEIQAGNAAQARLNDGVMASVRKLPSWP